MRLLPMGSSAVLHSSTGLSGMLLAVVFALLGFTGLEPDKSFSTRAFEPVCVGAVNVTINPDLCYAHIRVTSLLLGDYVAAEYRLELFDQAGNSLGDTIPGVYAGQTLNAQITHNLSNFSCTTTISVYDQSPPVLTLPDDVVLSCTEEPNPTTTGKATATDCTTVSVTYEDKWKETFCGNPKIEILRIWRAVDAQGLSTVDTQYIAIARATATDMRFPPDRDYTCTQYMADPNLIDATANKAGIPTLVTNPRCGLVYTYQDQRVAVCGDPATSFIILRRWTVLDACGNQLFMIDGAGNDNIQLIRVMDKTAPVIQPVVQDIPATVRKEDNGFALCSSVGFIPPPDIIDECNTVTIRMYSAIGELEYVNGTDGAEGGYIPFPGLTLGGPHQIYYEAVDACGNTSNTSAYIQVIDDEVPILLCDKQVTVSLSLDGRGRLEPFMIDEGVRDNCCLEKMQIKWVDDPIISFRDRIEIYCVGEARRAVLRAWDCRGNFNDCETTVVTHDPLPATIVSVPPEVFDVDCGTTRHIYDNPQYLAPLFQDNCPLDIQYTIRDSVNACGTADLWREWTVQDHPDHQVLRVGQLIRFIDQVAPQLNAPTIDPICDVDGDCEEIIRFPFIVTDNCSENLILTHRFSRDGGAFTDDPFGQILEGTTGWVIEGVYPIGKHEVYITATDACGNSSNGRYSFEIKDCAPPDLLCREDAVFVIGEDQQVVLVPEDFVDTATDACHAFNLSFANTEVADLIYDCDSLGQHLVSIWATDTENNRSKCTVSFTIDQVGMSCNPLGSLTGRVVNTAGAGVALVRMELFGPDTLHAVTNTDGYYRFEGVALNTEMELHPIKEINASNGVTVLDIIRVSRHILGLEHLTDPYQLLAADVNKSGTISIVDIIASRRVILGLSEFFGDHHDTWRFLPADYEFINPEKPLEERVTEFLFFKLVDEQTVIDLIGVKYGDVNGSADPKR